MKRKNEEIQFQKINGKRPKGKHLELVVNESLVEKIFIQQNIGKLKTHVRIIGSNLFNEKIAYPIKDPEKYTDIIIEIKKQAKNYYCSGGRRRFFSNTPEIEIRNQEL